MTEIEELREELTRWNTDHTAECRKAALDAISNHCWASDAKIEDLQNRIATLVAVVEDHRDLIENYDALKERIDTAAQDGGI